MTNRIMFTEVMVAEEQDMAGNNMDFHKSRDEITRLVSNDNTGGVFSRPNRRLRIFGRKTSKGQLCKSAQEGRTVPKCSYVIERSSKCWRLESAETGRVLPK